MTQELEQIISEASSQLNAAQTTQELYQVKVQFWGKAGRLTQLLKQVSSLPKEDRPQAGQQINQVKNQLEALYERAEDSLRERELNAQIEAETFDLSLPGPRQIELGQRHPVTVMIDRVVDIMARLGFSVRLGPIAETEECNFTKLNIPDGHPARDMQDTFYLRPGWVLRTHTSPVQIRTLESSQPPFRILAPGDVFRSDSDISHLPHFHQIEGLWVDRKVSMAELKGCLSFLMQELFGKELKTRFRPSFFPFTEPSAEFDCTCPNCSGQGCSFCKQTGWIEIGGCGLVNPKVFKACGYSMSDWQGFAFGLGIERMVVIQSAVSDIRFFPQNDLRFLRQFT